MPQPPTTSDPSMPVLIAQLDGSIAAQCPVCSELVELPQIARSADDIAESPADAERIRVGLLAHEAPRDAAGLRRVEEAARHVHTDVDLAPYEAHVRGHE